MNIPAIKFTAERRQELLQECFEIMEWLYTFEARRNQWRREPGFTDKLKQKRTYEQRLTQLRQQYTEESPVIPLCRCPYCHTVNHIALDYYGLDGLWWFYEESWRNWKHQQLCSHFWTLSGAVRLTEPVAPTPFRVEPGPEVPFVVAHALQNHPIQVVITQVQLGACSEFEAILKGIGGFFLSLTACIDSLK